MSTPPFGSESTSPRGERDAIEYLCDRCGRMLRVAASGAGRPAKCPQCGAIQRTPAPAGGRPPGAGAADSDNVPPPRADSDNVPPPRVESLSASETTESIDAAPASLPDVPPAREGSLLERAASPRPTLSLLASAAATHPTRETPTKRLFDRITAEIRRIFVGQDELVLGALVALFSSGHVLIEAVPGLGKTLFVRTLGRVLGCQFGRIQFTADLMPSDITGAPIFDMKTQEFRFRPGPVFAQLLLADEINRSPAKTHAALLEIMQEYRVTVDGKSHRLERPFLVLATQNPIESEGTYNLPEAQLDRFMFQLLADYPVEAEELKILELHSRQIDINQRLEEEIDAVTTPEEILRVTRENGDVRIDDRLIDYINHVVRLTRQWPQFHLGASPRAGIALMQAARTLAAFHGRDYAVPDDVVQIALPAMRHRVILTAEAEVEGRLVDELLIELIQSVEVPRI